MDLNTSKVICPLTSKPAKFYCKKENVNYYIEPESGLIFLHPMPSISDMTAYANEQYKEGVYQDYLKAKDLKILTAKERLNIIKRYKKEGSLLDVGCSSGYFLESACELGYEISGIEFSKEAVSKASSLVREKIHLGDAQTILRSLSNHFDVITAFDLIEHLQNPSDFLKDVFGALKPNGIIVMTTPDTDHFLRKLMRSSWPMLQPNQHTMLFSRSSLKNLLTRNGFSEVDDQPTYKYLTLKYLATQLAETNKILGPFINLISKMIPGIISSKPIAINISEFLVIAKKPAF